MDIEVLPPELSSQQGLAVVDSNNGSNSIPAQHNPNTIVNDIDHSTKIPKTRNISFISFQLCLRFVFFKMISLTSISHTINRAIIFAVFTSIAMVIGILTVYYTSPKPPGMFFLCYIFHNAGTYKPNKIVFSSTIRSFLKKIYY
jgi:hypothetical protein